MEALAVGLLLALQPAAAQLRPPNLSPDNLPETAFTCEDKVTGGYYADMEADCQLFHVCVQVSEYEFQDFHFLCPNDTVFDQQHLVCTNWFEVDCHAQLALVPLQFFSNDFGIKRGGEVGQDEDARLSSQGAKQEQRRQEGLSGQSGVVSRNRNTGRGQLEVGRRRPAQHRTHSQRRFPVRPSEDYEDGPAEAPAAGQHDPDTIAAFTGSTPVPHLTDSFTTTARPSRAAPSLGLLSGRNLQTGPALDRPAPALAPAPRPESQAPAQGGTGSRSNSFVSFGRDGRKPHVKSNIRAKARNGSRKKFFSKVSSHEQKQRRKAGHKVLLGPRGRKEIRFVAPAEEPEVEAARGPELRPDGRTPRVKADLGRREPEEERTLAPFVEQFFASPSSPKPFIFTGSDPSPRPRGADTLLTSAPEEETFFIPTVQPQTPPGPSTDLLPPSDLSLAARPKETRPVRFRGRHRALVASTLPATSLPATTLAAASLPGPTKPRVKSNIRTRGKFGKSSGIALNSVTSDTDCSNPFLCPPKTTARGRRPRVKSNLKAKKRNFWHGPGGAGNGPRRKIRRGRKIIRKPAQSLNQVSNEIPDNIVATVSAPQEEETEQFVPTVRTFAPTTQRPRTTTTDDFVDFFDSENDLFVASSTVSSVVFQGSPTPGGWASSPAPNLYDESGAQVSFSSPSPYGFGPSGRPRFNNIGAHVDLGPKKKILDPNELFFISSTVSNKIFIGDPEEAVTPPTPREEQSKASSRFSSFPIRGLNTLGDRSGAGAASGFPLRPRKSPFLHFGREPAATTPPTLSEDATDPATDPTPSDTTIRTVTKKAPRVKSNLLFNRRKPGAGRSKFSAKISSPLASKSLQTTPPTTEGAAETAEVLTTPAAVSEQQERRTSRKPGFHRRPFGGLVGGRPGGFANRLPSISFTNSLLSKRKRNRAKAAAEEAEVVEDEGGEEEETVVTTQPPPIATSTVFTAFGSSSSSFSASSFVSSSSSPTSSVEEELLDDEESTANEISPSELPPRAAQLPGLRKPRKWPSVKKAQGTNGNIRVEFKKASAVAAEDNTKSTFVKPDGRKPRVKANIRARKAHRGIFGSAQPEAAGLAAFRHSTKVTTNEEAFGGGEAFAEASSQLALAPPYTGEEEFSEEEDNTEKREVGAEAGPRRPNQLEAGSVLAKPVQPQLPSFIHLPNLQPVILNSRQDRRRQGPDLPPDVLARIQHITDIHSLPPLPSGAHLFSAPSRGPRVQSDLVRRKRPVLEERSDVVAEEEGPGEALPSLLDQLSAPAAISTSSSVSSSSSYSSSSSSAPQLSAFRALVQQTEKGDGDNSLV